MVTKVYSLILSLVFAFGWAAFIYLATLGAWFLPEVEFHTLLAVVCAGAGLIAEFGSRIVIRISFSKGTNNKEGL